MVDGAGDGLSQVVERVGANRVAAVAEQYVKNGYTPTFTYYTHTRTRTTWSLEHNFIPETNRLPAQPKE